MPQVSLALPPGIYRPGTEYQSKNRWYDSNLMRFHEGRVEPQNGWRVKSTSAMTGSPRAIITWTDNSAITRAGIGTHSKLYAMSRAGVLTDITPVGFTAGRSSAISGGGYGTGNYGAGAYGVPLPDNSLVQDASVWTLDTFGEYLIGMMAEDGLLYEWVLDGGTPAEAVTDAPTGRACFVTEEGMVVVLAADDENNRVQWSDQQDDTEWTPAATNQAGDYNLQTSGKLMLGKRIRGGSLIFSETDVFLMSYVGGVFVYGFQKVGENCGAISQNCVANLDNQVVWVSRTGLWSYNGYVQPIPCDVWGYVSSDINWQQASKISVEVDSAFGEVIVHYVSSGATEVDREFRWNYREGHFNIGSVGRLCGVNRGVFQYPLRCASDGYVYEHEVGWAYGGDTPYIETGPLELGLGDRTADIDMVWPDELSEGSVTMTFKVKFEPEGDETTFGPYTLTSKTDVRVCGRQVKIRYAPVSAGDFNIGNFRMNVMAGSER